MTDTGFDDGIVAGEIKMKNQLTFSIAANSRLLSLAAACAAVVFANAEALAANPFPNAQHAALESAPTSSEPTNELILIVKPGVSQQSLQQSLQKIEGTMEDSTKGKSTAILVKVDNVKQAATLAKQDKNFAGVMRNHKFYRQFTTKPNDPGFAYGMQSYLQQLNIPAAWALDASGQGVTIGSLDSGVDVNSPELNKQIADPGFNAATNKVGGEETDTGFGHGTFTMALAACATNNDLAFASPAFGAGIIPVVVINKEGYATEWTIAKGLNYLRKKRCPIANLSLNANPPNSVSDPDNHYLHAAIARFGGLVFNAAGNGGVEDTKAVSVPGLVTVSGLDPQLNPSSFSNYGTNVTFAAPAENINNTGVGGTVYVGAAGTSFASPLVAGIAAQILSTHPKLPLTTVLGLMEQTARKPSGYNAEKYGYGIPDAAAAINLANESF